MQLGHTVIRNNNFNFFQHKTVTLFVHAEETKHVKTKMRYGISLGVTFTDGT
jgi:hypothetical protein